MDSGTPGIGLDADAAADMLAWESSGFSIDAFRPHHAHRSRRAEQGPGPHPIGRSSPVKRLRKCR